MTEDLRNPDATARPGAPEPATEPAPGRTPADAVVAAFPARRTPAGAEPPPSPDHTPPSAA